MSTTQRWLFCSSLLWISASAFAPLAFGVSPSKTILSSTTAATDYDIVKVDLADGRDYPIYIGAGFSDDEGEYCD